MFAVVIAAYALASLLQTTAGVRHTLLWTSGLAVLVAVVLALIAAQSVARRLRRIVDFAARIASGDLTARIAENSSDEIGQVAAALDSTAHQLEHSFRGIRTGQQQLETLLNSMQEAVIAVSADGKVQWANRVMTRLTASGVRLGAPVVETVRDPDFLRAVTEAIQSGGVRTTRATSIFPGRFYNVTAAPMPGAGVVAVLHDVQRDRARGEDPPRFRGQRVARAAYAADLDPGIRRDLAGIGPGRRAGSRVPGDHPQECRTHGHLERGPAHAGARGIRGSGLPLPGGRSGRDAGGTSPRALSRSPGRKGWS